MAKRFGVLMGLGCLAIQAANYGVALVSVEERDMTADFLLAAVRRCSVRCLFLFNLANGSFALIDRVPSLEHILDKLLHAFRRDRFAPQSFSANS